DLFKRLHCNSVIVSVVDSGTDNNAFVDGVGSHCYCRQCTILVGGVVVIFIEEIVFVAVETIINHRMDEDISDKDLAIIEVAMARVAGSNLV
ncbi:hypothetical protein NDU88_001712, partial [Pleurodeles waltl]